MRQAISQLVRRANDEVLDCSNEAHQARIAYCRNRMLWFCHSALYQQLLGSSLRFEEGANTEDLARHLTSWLMGSSPKIAWPYALADARNDVMCKALTLPFFSERLSLDRALQLAQNESLTESMRGTANRQHLAKEAAAKRYALATASPAESHIFGALQGADSLVQELQIVLARAIARDDVNQVVILEQSITRAKKNQKREALMQEIEAARQVDWLAGAAITTQGDEVLH